MKLRKSPLKRSGKPLKKISDKKLKGLGRMPYSTIARKVNPVAKAKRDKRYKSHLSSAYWKALRQRVWERMVVVASMVFNGEPSCEECGAPMLSIREMQLAHLTYARFGHENEDDVQGQCKNCNQTEAALRGKRISSWACCTSRPAPSCSYTKSHLHDPSH